MKLKIFYVSLGCDKNLVDSEVMLGMMDKEGYIITSSEEEADIIIVNTCSFIHDAKEESIETILEMAEYKEMGNCKGLIVVGCLSERYKDELMLELPEVDGVLGTSNYDEIIETIKKVIQKEKVSSFKDINYTPEINTNRMISTTAAYAYLKIAEGCNNNCTYCIIPKLRGKIRSREINSLIEEAKFLVDQGKKEIILVAQDLTKYGIDLYKEKKLPELIRELCKIEGLEWIRLLYCYPEDISEELIEVIRTEDKIIKYIDIPIQHINDSILKSMARKSNKDTIIKVINRLREAIPEICIRSTLIVGFPGETKEQFIELKEFIKEFKIDRLGVFTYSLEEGTKAATMDYQIEESIKESRKEELMLIQQKISFEKNNNMIDSIVDVIIEGYLPEEKVYIGRSYMDAPNVDGVVFIHSQYNLMTGQIIKVRVIEANEYDLIGEIEDEYSK